MGFEQDYRIAFESNSSSITTSASGAIAYTAGKLQQVSFAMASVPGYVAVVTGTSGQTINIQLYEQSAATGALTEPTAAVTIDAGDLQILELGN